MDIEKKTQQVKKKRNNAATPQKNADAFKTQPMGTLYTHSTPRVGWNGYMDFFSKNLFWGLR